MKSKRLICTLLAVMFVIFSVGTSSAAGADDIQTILSQALTEHREFATQQQDDALKAVEETYNNIKLLGKTQQPWSDIISLLLTQEIKDNEQAKRALELEALRCKQLTISGTVDQTITDKLAAFTLSNDSVDIDFDLSEDTAAEAAGKFSAMSSRLSTLYNDLTTLRADVSAAGAVLQVESTDYTGLSQDVYEDMMTAKIFAFVSDINSVAFSSKDTHETAVENLFSDANKKFIGLIFGSDFASALADAATTTSVNDYFKSQKVLETVVKYQVDLFDGTFAQANTALNSLLTEVSDGLLALPSMSEAKTAMENVGWTPAVIVSACSTVADAADSNYCSRIINLNMIFGRHAQILKNDKLITDFEINTATADNDEYDVVVSKNSYSASILNVIDTNVFEQDETESTRVVPDDDNGALKFTLTNDSNDTDYTLNIYRSGGTQDVYGFITSCSFDVITDNTVPVTGLNLRQGDEEDIYVDSTLRLTYILTPNKATNKAVQWDSSNPSVATVDDIGLVKGISAGDTVITITSDDGNFSDTITIHVKKKKSINLGGGGSVTPSTPVVTPIPTQIPTPTSSPSHLSFSDLDGHWASNELSVLIENDYITGYSNGNFYPDKQITRAEFSVIVTKMMGLTPIEGISFVDTENHWSKNYVSTACKYGLMIGFDDNTFLPDAVIPREQVICVLLRALTFGGNVVNDGVTVGISGNEVIEKIIENLGADPRENAEIGLVDIDSCSSWAKPYVEIAYVQGWANGYDDKTIRPLNNSTRAEAAVLAKRALLNNEK